MVLRIISLGVPAAHRASHQIGKESRRDRNCSFECET
jgi:hypothetical protein